MTIPEFLKPYSPYSALMINWKVFGSNGHLTRPTEGGVLKSYTTAVPVDDDPEVLSGISLHVKSIVQPRYVKRVVVGGFCF